MLCKLVGSCNWAVMSAWQARQRSAMVSVSQGAASFGTDCQACHDGIDTHGSNFDHNEVPFHLVGIHALTACSECHVNARNLPGHGFSEIAAVSRNVSAYELTFGSYDGVLDLLLPLL